MKSVRSFPAGVGFALIAFTLAPPADAEEPAKADLIIYGGTSAGIAAAVQASRLDRTAILIEPSRWIGGLTTGGLGWTDTGRDSAIGGISREFYQRVHRHYSNPEAWPLQNPETLNQDRRTGRFLPGSDAMWVFEPKVATGIFEEMLAECVEHVTVHTGERLDREKGVDMEDGRITEIRTLSGKSYRGAMFLDATYEGDLMAAAGVSYHVGRESNALYGEELNGVQKTRMKGHLFIQPVDPYLVPGDPSSGLVARVHGDEPGEDGAGDDRIQAYNFRMCMSDDPRNRVPFPKPDGYDDADYELLFRNFEAGDMRLPLSLGRMPNHKTDTNNLGAFSTDNIGMNYAYPDGSHAERAAIVAEHERYQKGLMWTLANHPRVPQEIRDRMAKWGLAADEFTDNGNWPHQIYVREARRMVSDYVMSENDCRRVRVAEDSVGLGSYNMDSHNTQRYVTPEGTVQNEGDVQVSPGGPYAISYRSIIPKREECANLLVPVCVSSSHIAFGSIRMEPVFMILGHSAATAAVLSIERGHAVQDLPYEVLRESLLMDGQVLDLPPEAKPKILLTSASLPGIVVDDNAAKYTGQWTPSTSSAVYIDTGYHHDGHEEIVGVGIKAAAFTADLPESGHYEVLLSYPAHPNRASNTKVTIAHRNGEEILTLDQRKNTGDEAGFVSLGSFPFDGGSATVTITNENADGYVVVDAVQFLAD